MHRIASFALRTAFSMLILVISASAAFSQTFSTSVGGGTLSWQASESGGGDCTEQGGSSGTYTDWSYGSFSFTLNSSTQSLSGSAIFVTSPGNGSCPVPGPQPSSLTFTVDGLTITFEPAGEGEGSATSIETPNPVLPQPSGLQYFGFYDSGTPGFPDEAESIAGFANTVWIGCDYPAECDSRLQEAKYFNMHAVVALSGPALGGSDATIENWNANWANYEPIFKPYVNDGTIAAFYPYDEPFGAWTPQNGDLEITSFLEEVANSIKSDFPTARVAVVLTGVPSFTLLTHGENVIPQNFDWIGIDIYNCWSTCSYSDTYNSLSHDYAWYVSELEANLYENQKVFLLPGTSIYYSGSYDSFLAEPSGFWPPLVSSNTSIVSDILSLAQGDSHVLGIFGYQYQTYYDSTALSIADSGAWIAANDPSMGPILDDMTSFGTSVMKRSFTPPSLTGTIVQGQPVELINKNSQKCLDVTNVATSPGVDMQQFECLGSGQLNQMWRLYQVAAGEYQIVSLSNNLFEPPQCLYLYDGETANGTAVQQSSCSAAGTNTDQLWYLTAMGGGYQVKSAASGNCLDVYADETGNGVQVYSWQCLGAGQSSQIWDLGVPAMRAVNAAANNPVF